MKRNTEDFGTLLNMKTVIVFCSLILSSVEKDEEAVIRQLSYSIGEMVLACQAELEFKNDVIRDLFDFWNLKNQLRSTDLGCALVCVFEENEFLNEDGSEVMADNVDVFFKAVGADEIMSHKMVKLFQLCKKSTRTIQSMCDSALEMAKCFRYGIFLLQWAPERFYWNGTEADPDSLPEQVSDETVLPAVRSEMNQRIMFTKLFRSCRK